MDSGQWTVKATLKSWAPVAILLMALGGSYYGTIAQLVGRWMDEPDYNWCFLVVPFAIILLYTRREIAPSFPLKGSFWGLGLLIIPGLLRLVGAYTQMAWLDQISLVPSVAALVILVAGWNGLRWSWPAVCYLVFMVPLPGQVASLAGPPLQTIGAHTSAYLLQMMRIPATVEGTVIQLTSWPLNVEEACSGLRMLMLFLAVCAGAALIVQRPAWERVVIILSAPPIAILSNVIRITLTGVFYETAGREWAEMVFHDLFGWVMMPLAIILLWLEMFVLTKLFNPSDEEGSPDEEEEWL